MRPDTGGGKTEEEGDIGGEGRDDSLVGMMETVKVRNASVSIQVLSINKMQNKPRHSLVSSFLLQLEGRRGRREVLHDACLFDWWRR